MRTQKAYCSACDRQVEVLVPDDLPAGALPSAHDASNCVCLEYGETCTGSMCPLFDVPTPQMEENYRRKVREAREARDAQKEGGAKAPARENSSGSEGEAQGR